MPLLIAVNVPAGVYISRNIEIAGHAYGRCINRNAAGARYRSHFQRAGDFNLWRVNRYIPSALNYDLRVGLNRYLARRLNVDRFILL